MNVNAPKTHFSPGGGDPFLVLMHKLIQK